MPRTLNIVLAVLVVAALALVGWWHGAALGAWPWFALGASAGLAAGALALGRRAHRS